MAVKSATFRKQFLQLVGEAYDNASKGNNLEKFVDGITAFCGRGSRAMRSQSQPVPASTDDGTTPWLADEAGIVEWIRKKNNGGKEIKIISGLEAIRISSPQDFLAETLNVHRPDDANAWLLLEEKLTRAVEAKSDFGWREFILCRENWQKIHPSWWSHWQYFAWRSSRSMACAALLSCVRTGAAATSTSSRSASSPTAMAGSPSSRVLVLSSLMFWGQLDLF